MKKIFIVTALFLTTGLLANAKVGQPVGHKTTVNDKRDIGSADDKRDIGSADAKLALLDKRDIGSADDKRDIGSADDKRDIGSADAKLV